MIFQRSGNKTWVEHLNRIGNLSDAGSEGRLIILKHILEGLLRENPELEFPVIHPQRFPDDDIVIDWNGPGSAVSLVLDDGDEFFIYVWCFNPVYREHILSCKPDSLVINIDYVDSDSVDCRQFWCSGEMCDLTDILDVLLLCET